MPETISISGYKIERQIGIGGMARVYRGTQNSLGRKVALKVLHQHLIEGEDFKERFMHEGRLLAKLNHPNIVAIHDIGQSDDIFYMAMEFLPEGTLSERIRNGMTLSEILRITTQIAHALQLAHDNHIVHRDLKPSNIMFRDELTPILTDFGIARKTNADSRMTKTGMVVGTPHYMSPEQISGKEVDGRSDLYSLGVMLHELLTGSLPFTAEEPLALAMQHLQEPPPRLPEKYADLQEVIDKMLAKDPDQRFQNMLEFCFAIKELVSNKPEFAGKLSGETKLFDSSQFSDPRFSVGKSATPSKRGGSSDMETLISKPNSMIDSSPMKAYQLPWKIPAAVIGVCLTAVLIWFFIGGGDGLNEEERRRAESMISVIDNHITGDRITEPENENAVAALKQLLQFAPEFEPALERKNTVATLLTGKASLKLGQNELQQASNLIQLGLSVAPKNKGLMELEKTIQQTQAAAQKAKQIADLTTLAQQRINEGQLITPNDRSAFDSYQEILKLDPENPSARRGLVALQESVLESIQTLLSQGQITNAEPLLTRLDQLFPESSLIIPVRKQFLAQKQRQAQDREVAQLRQLAKSQMAAQQFIEPAGDNALNTFQSILNIRTSDREALKGLQTIASHFTSQAQQAYDQQNFPAAADFARLGLRAAPESSTLLAIQSQSTNALDAQSRLIEETLQEAERLELSGQLLPGSENNAYDRYQDVLTQDPGNERALQALNNLPDTVLLFAQQLQASTQYDDAQNLLSQAQQIYSDDQRFLSLQTDIYRQQQQQQRQLQLQNMIEEMDAVAGGSQITVQSIEQAITKLDEIRKSFPNDPAIIQQANKLARTIAASAEKISESGDDEYAFLIVETGLTYINDHPALLSQNRLIEARQQDRIEQEKQRIAATSGQMAIDATPWGEVIGIVDARGKAIELPENTITPLVVTVPEGSYRIQVRGSNPNLSQTLNVTVKRQSLKLARVAFDQLDANSYFEKSDW